MVENLYNDTAEGNGVHQLGEKLLLCLCLGEEEFLKVAYGAIHRSGQLG